MTKSRDSISEICPNCTYAAGWSHMPETHWCIKFLPIGKNCWAPHSTKAPDWCPGFKARSTQIPVSCKDETTKPMSIQDHVRVIKTTNSIIAQAESTIQQAKDDITTAETSIKRLLSGGTTAIKARESALTDSPMKQNTWIDSDLADCRAVKTCAETIIAMRLESTLNVIKLYQKMADRGLSFMTKTDVGS